MFIYSAVVYLARCGGARSALFACGSHMEMRVLSSEMLGSAVIFTAVYNAGHPLVAYNGSFVVLSRCVDCNGSILFLLLVCGNDSSRNFRGVRASNNCESFPRERRRSDWKHVKTKQGNFLESALRFPVFTRSYTLKKLHIKVFMFLVSIYTNVVVVM